MNLVIDSDILIYFLKGQIEIVEKLTAYPAEALFTTRINVTELLYGAYYSTKVQYNLKKITALLAQLPILEFDQQAGLIFAQDKAALKRQGNLIADMDLMIASITKANGFCLVTNNGKHFERIENLQLARWM
jgi:tRNA(fMet)-specific endonuclease VapC